MADIAKLVNAALKGSTGKMLGVRAMTLVKVTAGTRTPGAISAGTNPVSTNYAARGLIADYSAYEMAASTISVGDRKISLLGASIAGGQVPAPDDRIIDGATTYTIAKGGVTAGEEVAGEGRAALWICQVRK